MASRLANKHCRRGLCCRLWLRAQLSGTKTCGAPLVRWRGGARNHCDRPPVLLFRRRTTHCSPEECGRLAVHPTRQPPGGCHHGRAAAVVALHSHGVAPPSGTALRRPPHCLYSPREPSPHRLPGAIVSAIFNRSLADSLDSGPLEAANTDQHTRACGARTRLDAHRPLAAHGRAAPAGHAREGHGERWHYSSRRCDRRGHHPSRSCSAPCHLRWQPRTAGGARRARGESQCSRERLGGAAAWGIIITGDASRACRSDATFRSGGRSMGWRAADDITWRGEPKRHEAPTDAAAGVV